MGFLAHKKPLTFTSNATSHLQQIISILLAFSIPALATKTSTVPYLIVLSIAFLTCFSLLTSHLIISGFLKPTDNLRVAFDFKIISNKKVSLLEQSFANTLHSFSCSYYNYLLMSIFIIANLLVSKTQNISEPSIQNLKFLLQI